jgi:D-sedoheptulose 7-phosphate isomerase
MEIKKQIRESIQLKSLVLADESILEAISNSIHAMVACFRKDGKVLFCGNGGSAADAQHLASELSGRFYLDRPPLNAEALHVNTSFLTATANDYSFEMVYQRMIMALGRKGDVLVALSTSGQSPNILRALEAGRKQGMTTIGLTGKVGGGMQALCDILIRVPSEDTPRIQEVHILIGHVLCEQVEAQMFGK